MSYRKLKCEGGGIGRRARLRGVWFNRAGSSPVPRTNEAAGKDISLSAVFIYSILFLRKIYSLSFINVCKKLL